MSLTEITRIETYLRMQLVKQPDHVSFLKNILSSWSLGMGVLHWEYLPKAHNNQNKGHPH